MSRIDRFVGRWFLLFLSLIAFIALSGSVVAESLEIENYQLISKTKVAGSANNDHDKDSRDKDSRDKDSRDKDSRDKDSRDKDDHDNDIYEYVYRAALGNDGVSVYDARATLSSTSREIEVIQGSLTFDLVLADQTITSIDTFSIRAKNGFDKPGKDRFDKHLVGKGRGLDWKITAKTDTVAPVIGVQSPKDIFVASAKPAISAQYQDAESGVDVSKTRLLLDGVDVSSSATVTTTDIRYQPASALTEGSHTLEISVTDRIGNTARSTWSFSVDTIPPAISAQTPADASILANTTPAISAQYQDAGGVDISKVQLTVDGASVVGNATVSATGISYQPSALAQGRHAIVLTVVDVAGNSSQSAWSLTVDTVPPAISLQTPADGSAQPSSTPAIGVQYQDAGGVDVSKVQLTVDGANVTTSAATSATGISYQPAAALAQGNHAVALTVVDLAGNSSQSAWNFSVDTIPPAISLQKPADGSILANGKPAISAQYQDAGGVDIGKVQLTIDGVNMAASAAVSATGISYQPAAALAQGKHVIALTVLDLAGNSSQSVWNVSINTTLDPVALTPASTDAGVAATAVVSVKIAASDIEGGSVILQKLDAQGRAVDIGNLHDDGLQSDATANDGTHTLRFTIYEQNPGVLTYRVAAKVTGQTAPLYSSPLDFNITGVSTAVTLTQPLNLAFVNISPIIVAGTTSDPAATIKVNGIPAAKSSSSFQLTVPLQEGTNTITAVATNSNATTTTTSLQVTLDTTPPKVTVTSPADGYKTAESSVTVTGIVNDIVVGTVNDQQAKVTVNGVNAQVINRTYTATNIPLQAGVNTLRIVGTDRTGNSATATIRVTQQQVSGAAVKMVSGNNQTGTIATQLAAPLAVQVLNGVTPVANVPVIFKIKENDGLLKSATSQSSIVIVNTDAAGNAQATYTLGNRAGAGNNVVEAYSTGAKGIAVFTASATAKMAAMVNVDSGNNQFGAVNQALVLPFVAVVTDQGYNRLGGIPVTFTAKQGGGTFTGGSVDANGIATLQTVTDSDGRALATLTLGTQPGQDNNVVEAAVTDAGGQPLSSVPAVFTATAKVPGDPANTRISGVVLDNSNNPIPGVTMRLYQTYQGNNNNQHLEVVPSVVTDAKGMFTIAPAPVGLFKLMADGVTATDIAKLYPTLEFDLVTVAGQDNTVGMPIYLQSLDILNRVCVTDTTGGTLNIPGSPGFTLTIKPGSATFPGGSKTGCVSATPVNIDKIPMSPGFGQQPRYVVTIQPVGTTFNPPMSMTMPNVDGLAPRAKTEMYSYDHDLAAFVAIGSATVSADGSTISSDPGIGVMKAGWHCGGNPNSTGSAGTCPECKKCSGSNCVADNSQTPGPFYRKLCKKPICNGGAVEFVNNDAEKLADICRECRNGTDQNREDGSTPDDATQCCHNGYSLPKLGNPLQTLIDQCPKRQQVPESVRQHDVDGCSDGLTSNIQDPMLGMYGPMKYGIKPTTIGLAQGLVPKSEALGLNLACNSHDICYQTCKNDKGTCDLALKADIATTCEAAYPPTCPLNLSNSDCFRPDGYFDQRNQCSIGPFNFAWMYYQGVNWGASTPYADRQQQYCQCCP
jgi:membrane-bound inhibitor of C-type lysozyme